MKRYLLLLACIALLLPIKGQNRVEYKTDIFGNLEYKLNNLQATLEKDIFGGLIYQDNNKNRVSYSEEYIQKTYNTTHDDKELQHSIFNTLIRTLRFEKNYKEDNTIDIFGTVIFKNNRGDHVEIDPDFIDYSIHHNPPSRNKYTITENTDGSLEYQGKRGQQAILRELKLGAFKYEDSNDNVFEFSRKGWQKALQNHKSKKSFFIYLIDNYLE